MSTASNPFPTSAEVARSVIDRADELGLRSGLISIREIELGAGVGRGVLSRIQRIAEGEDLGSFNYESAVRIVRWIDEKRSAASEGHKNTGGPTNA